MTQTPSWHPSMGGTPPWQLPPDGEDSSDQDAPRNPEVSRALSAGDILDPQAVADPDRADCCNSRAAYVAVLSPTASRPHESRLLFCGHHFRAAQRALETAGARVLDLV